MLNRRHLRLKVMQAIYAFVQSSNSDLNKGEKDLLSSIEKTFELYVWYLSLIPEIVDFAKRVQDDAKLKMLPTSDDLNPNTGFTDSKVALQLSTNIQLQQFIKNKKISWQQEPELIKKIFLMIKGSDEYILYLNTKEKTYKDETTFWTNVFKNHLVEYEPLEYFFEDKSVLWVDDFEIVYVAVLKTIKSLKESSNSAFALQPLYKDEIDDREFVVKLFRETILNSQEYETLIAKKTENWEVERIALMDVLLMKMAMAEAVTFSNIPLKVTLNEYIELSKFYSTPKSKSFINGILDKLVIDFKQEGKINKIGRGLLED